MIHLPNDVLEYLARVFGQCNLAVSKKISKIPNIHESSLDMTLIEQLSNYSAPATLGSGWTVRIDTHYLGGGSHFGAWEIADIGFLVMFRRAGRLVRSKVALLQCKRLYPSEVDFDEATTVDYIVGFAGLLESDDTFRSVASPRTFTFKQSSKYEALRKEDDQYQRIERFENHNGVPVHYLLYHPLRVPSSSNTPRTTTRTPRGPNRVGCRIVRSESVRQALTGFSPGYVPCYGDLRCMLPTPYDTPQHEVG